MIAADPPRKPLYDLDVLHVGSGSYQPHDTTHSTYAIWRALAAGFRRYHVFGRSTAQAAEWTDGNLTIRLFRRGMEREFEFLWKQFELVSFGRALKPAVIICQSPALGGLAALKIARKTGAGVLIEIHGNEYFAEAGPGSRNWFLQRLSHYALRRASLIRVLSTGMKARLLKRYGSELAGKVRILPPRVDLERFNLKPGPGFRNAALRLIMVGAVNENKGQLRLIRALRGSAVPIELHIVGDGPDLPACRAEAAKAPPSLLIVCHGAQIPERVAELLAGSDVFIMYSKSEGTPRAMMEAMATGLPIVTTDAGFCADVVEAGTEGVVLGPDPDREIVPVLEDFLRHPEVPRRMGLASRARAERDYAAAVLFGRYRDLIAEAARQ